MALNYHPITAEQEKKLSVIEKGEYDFYVKECKQERSKGGLDKEGKQKPVYDMVVPKLMIMDNLGRERPVTDWVLVVPAEDRMGFKLRHFAISCGLEERYLNGSLSAQDFIGKHGVVKIAIRDAVDKNGEKYLTNSVVDYMKPLENAPKKSNDDFLDDDIPAFG